MPFSIDVLRRTHPRAGANLANLASVAAPDPYTVVFTLIGTGPYMFKEWKKGSSIHLARNPGDHIAGKPHLDEIHWHVIPDAAARAVAFETGKVDILPGGAVGNFGVPRLTRLRGEALRRARGRIRLVFQDPFASLNPRRPVRPGRTPSDRTRA